MVALRVSISKIKKLSSDLFCCLSISVVVGDSHENLVVLGIMELTKLYRYFKTIYAMPDQAGPSWARPNFERIFCM